MPYLLKTEPSTYSFADLQDEGTTIWDGVTNPAAVKNLRGMKAGEKLLIYHTGDEKQVVGIVEIIKEAYKDPTDEKGVFYAVDTKAIEPLKTPVALGAIKAEPKLKNMALAREPRLSVQPVTAEEWKLVCRMGGVKG